METHALFLQLVAGTKRDKFVVDDFGDASSFLPAAAFG